MGSRNKSNKRHYWKWMALLAVVVLLLVIWHIHENHKKQEEEQNKPPSVHVIEPKASPAETTLTLPGTLQAIAETPIYARTNGYLAQWYHDIGDQVKRGDLIADIDTPDVDQQLLQAKGTLHQAEANREIARITAERWQALVKQHAVSQQETDQNVANFRVQEANVEAAQAQVEQLTYLQSFKKLYAPFDGVVTERTVDRGALINSGNAGGTGTPSTPGGETTHELFRVAQIDTMKMYVGVPQSEARAIKPGINVDILLQEFPDRKFTGTIVRSSHELDANARTLLTEIDIPNSDGMLLPGMYAQARLHFPEPTPSLIVPASVIVIHSDKPKIITVDDDNKLHFVTVTIGRDFGQQTEITSGLDDDAQMVRNPSDILVEGEEVTIEEDKQEAPKAPREDSDKDKKDKKDKEKKSDKADNASSKSGDEGKAKKKDDAADKPDAEKSVTDSKDTLPKSYEQKPTQGKDQDDKKDSDKKDESK